MNEKFLSRGKQKGTKAWVKGYYFEHEGNYGIVGLDDKYNSVMPETVGRYICVTDKKGVEIFEGDIVGAERSSEIVVGVVEYDKYLAAFVLNDGEYSYLFGDDITSDLCEVINNIYDAPDIVPEKLKNFKPKPTPDTEEIKSCPLCGGDAELQLRSNIKMGSDTVGWSYSIGCKKCGLKLNDAFETHVGLKPNGEMFFKKDDRKEAIAKWNRRFAENNSEKGIDDAKNECTPEKSL